MRLSLVLIFFLYSLFFGMHNYSYNNVNFTIAQEQGRRYVDGWYTLYSACKSNTVLIFKGEGGAVGNAQCVHLERGEPVDGIGPDC